MLIWRGEQTVPEVWNRWAAAGSISDLRAATEATLGVCLFIELIKDLHYTLHLSDECKAVNHQAQLRIIFSLLTEEWLWSSAHLTFLRKCFIFKKMFVSLCGPRNLCDITVPENQVVFIQTSCSVTSALYSFSCRGLSVRCIQAPSEMLKSCAKKRHPHVQLLNYGNKTK